MKIAASATSSHQVTGWVVYVDSKIAFQGSGSSIDSSINVSDGTHQVVFRAWDSTGADGSESETVTVTSGSSGGGLPTPPSNAIVFNNIQDRGGWWTCNSSSCAGGSGKGSYWMAQNQSSPSLTGSSLELYNSGAWANALFVQKLGGNSSVHNFLWDFYFYLDSHSSSATQALEFDTFQFISGYNYMMGSQCDYAAGVWDTWDEASGHWAHTAIACPKFSSDAWHHVQWYVQTIPGSHQYKYVTLVVDGLSHSVNYIGTAKYLGWSSNLGVQWQLDVNASGEDYHEWVDKAKLTMW